MVDKSKKYLFHNVYGDAQGLIDNKDESVVCVPWGPEDAVELARNEIINELGMCPSCLPSLIYWKPLSYYDTYIGDVPKRLAIPAHWAEIRIEDMQRHWNWDDINERTV